MAKIKKNQLANIVFPMVDKTDFASIESGITASDFNSAATKKFYGVTHGNSTAFTSGTISKATTLVRSGIFQQTLEATETNYDYIMYRFVHPSCADQLLVFETATYDDSDIFSQLSDIGSNLLSYMTGMSGMLSDVDSQLLLNASMISDVQSALDSQFLIVTSNISDVDSQLLLNASMISDVYSLVSDVDSQLLLNASVISDIQSALDSQFLIVTSNISDVDSQLLLNASMISDIQSALDSQFVWTSNFLSDMNSDLASKIGNVSVTLTVSDISDIASAVAVAVGSDISDIYSLLSDVDSQLNLNASMISDVQSALDSQFLIVTSNLSDVESQVDLLATSNYLSQVASDLSSQIGGITASVSASDMSDIASRVWATTEGTRVDSRILVIQSLVSDVESQLDLNASMVSDIQSALDSQFVWESNFLSDMNSDLASKIGGITASIGASDISDIASAVWADTIGTRVDSRIVLLQSNVSDIESQIDLDTSTLSDIYSLLSDVDSQLNLNASVVSDVQSALDSQFTWTSAFLSDMNSDLSSQIGNISVTLTTSDISDIASAITAAGVSITASDMSDIASRVWAETVRTLTPTTAGALAFTYTVTDSGTGFPIEGAEVWITTDIAGANIIWNGHTNALGVARDDGGILPYLDPGTYYFWSQKSGYTFSNPDTETVS